MLRLIDVEYGKVGKICHYQHPRHGVLEIIHTWGAPGAEIIHLQTYKVRRPCITVPAAPTKRARR
jgi:hypothetical protein